MKPDDFLKNEYSYTKKFISLTRFNIDYEGNCLGGMECKSYQKVGTLRKRGTQNEVRYQEWTEITLQAS